MEEEIAIEYYEATNGKSPYLNWENSLTPKIRASITARIARIRLGNFGDCKSIKGEKSLFELRLQLGPGYRVYFGKKGRKIVILLCGGDKGSQKRDISKEKNIGKIVQDREENYGKNKKLQRASN